MKIISLFIVCFCFLPAIAQNEEPLKAGMKAPGFSYRDVDGNVVCLKDLRGKYVYALSGRIARFERTQRKNEG